MPSFTETIKGQRVTIEVTQVGRRFDGLAFCPMKECRDKSKSGFTARSRSTEGRAKSDAKTAVRNHLGKVHQL